MSWVPVSFHDSPKGPVLTWNGSDVLIAVRVGDRWFEFVTGQTIRCITHWTTLPEPPSEVA